MLTLGLLAAALLGTYAAARRSLSAGFGVLMIVGYAYGLIRANLLDGYSHLLFDSALLGLYAARLFRPMSVVDRVRTDELRTWVILLMGWPVVLFLVPTQDIMVELVGLRGNIFMLPCLLLGAMLTRDDVYRLAVWIGALNLAAGAFAAVQFFVGIEPFFPRNAVTEIIYRSGDIARSTAFRIPSSFTSAHAYAGTMVLTLPVLLGAWTQPARRPLLPAFFAASIVVSSLGIFATGARIPFVLLLVIAGTAMFSGSVRIGHKLRWIFVGAIVVWFVSGEERLQRFMTLSESDVVGERLSGSVNLGFFELISQYPLGNGLGGGGTSIPYFLQERVRNVVVMENDYARLALEQGIPGLLLWVAFLIWLFTRWPPADLAWRLPRVLMRICAASVFATGLIGLGLLTAIPSTALLLLTAGWIALPERVPDDAAALPGVAPGGALPYGAR